MPLIEANLLCRDFKVYEREKGFVSNLKSMFHRKYRIVHAVSDINLSIDQGEIVGYIGANGAGKSTTIKMLSGILVPTSGDLFVNGTIPHKNRKKNAMGIGVVFGQRSQLNWDLPMEDTFELYQKMYRIPDAAYKHNVSFFVELLDMQDFLRKPVRQLSLGQKMRAEIAVALLHDPKILYLDEPTIGLDVVVKEKIRKFIRQLRDEKSTTVILTTHDMDDIDQICDRIVMIDKGKKLVDESLEGFKQRYNEDYYMEVTFGGEIPAVVSHEFTQISQVRSKTVYRFIRREMAVRDAMRYFANNFDIADITMRNASLEEIVRKLY